MAKRNSPSASSAEARWAGFQPPPPPHAAKHSATLQRVQRMTPDEVFRSSVDAGIHRHAGDLTDGYTRKR